jgi:hypothetical protein
MAEYIQGYVDETRRGIHLCLENALVIPGVSLLYSGIDVLGFLASDKEHAQRSTFIEWAEKYMGGLLARKGIAGIDLYSARCGLLHTGQAPSELVDTGKARELWYRFRDKDLWNAALNAGQVPVLIDVEELASAFDRGVEEFLTDLAEDEILRARTYPKERFFRTGLLVGPL